MATSEKDNPTLMDKALNLLAEKLTNPTSGEDAKQPINSAIAKCHKETNKIYIALTIDDGPRSAITPKFVEFLDKNNIPATWYIVRTNVEAIGDSYYKTLKEMQDRGHEIAIHEALPESENTEKILSGVKKDAEHIPVFPTDHKDYGKSYYKDVNDWARHIKEFKQLLNSKGINVNFIRIPGGLDTELAHMISKIDLNGLSKNEMISYINKSKADRGIKYNEVYGNLKAHIKRRMKVKEVTQEEIVSYINKNKTDIEVKNHNAYDKLNIFATALEDVGLKSWGSKRIRNDKKDIALNYIAPLSWTSEISSKKGDIQKDLEDRLLRFNEKGEVIKPTHYPYIVVLTHDNNGYLSNFKKEIKAVVNKSLIEKNQETYHLNS